MQIKFLSPDPRRRARPALDDILNRGTDQIALAVAYCTAAGVQILKPHAARINKPDSFVVVSVDPPTDYAALAELNTLIPGRLFVHWGALLPQEIEAPAPLMHSKVFYARAGGDCWLWTGSHNLTGNAFQGVNCEAALLLEGKSNEEPFVDALQHLTPCKNQAHLYDPDKTPPWGTGRANIAVIHAEADAVPTDALPWHVHLCLDTADFDDILPPGVEVRLFLYPKGSLLGGWREVIPIAAYSGSLSGQNLTAINPNVRVPGVLANWQDAKFSITEERSVLFFGPSRSPGARVTTQAVINLDTPSAPDETLFSEAPKVKLDKVPGQAHTEPADHDLKQFYTPKSVQGEMLVHVPVAERRRVLKVPAWELRQSDRSKIAAQFPADENIFIEAMEEPTPGRKKRHPFITRARYRLREQP
jgi:hypothetical protein